MSTSTRADLSTEVTAFVIVLAQCPHVMSLILRVTIDFSISSWWRNCRPSHHVKVKIYF